MSKPIKVVVLVFVVVLFVKKTGLISIESQPKKVAVVVVVVVVVFVVVIFVQKR